MKCRIILELLAILFFTGCYNREQISRLDEAEALIQNIMAYEGIFSKCP